VSIRNRELVFLIPALVLTTLGFALVYSQKSLTLSWSSLTYGGLFLALFAIAHIGRRVLAPYADPYLLPVTALLSTLGILVIYRLNEKLALQQALWLVVGLVAFLLVLAFVRDLRVLRDYRFVIGIAGLLLLLFTAIFGREINGARLWVAFGPIRFQPAEFGKILLVVFFAAYLVDIREALTVSTRRVLGVPLPPFRYLAPILTIWALSMVLMIFMKDLGTSLLFFGALLALLYAATGRFFYVVVGLALFVAGAALLYYIFPHVQSRIDVWLDPWKDPSGKGYQIVQSLFALAAGGLFGRGLGQGYLILPSGRSIIPALETDFIFSAIGEELGMVGAMGIILLYLIFTYRGFRIAVRSRDDFSRLLATGLTGIFALQAFIIMGGVIKLIPLTGITLPFVSYGGSSIVANFVLLALLLRASDQVARDEAAGREPGLRLARTPGRARSPVEEGG
jgi:cell division protein FtsW (lipid II flippase)